jgi:hypothetical protein
MIAASHADGLEVRKTGSKWQVFDMLTNSYLGSPSGSRHWLQVALDERRASFRPIIVRWIYGIPTAKSIELGVTEGRS